MAKTKRKLIGGTNSDNKYLVFAESEDGDFEIAFRPLIEIRSKSTDIGFRIRAAPKTYSDSDVVTGNFSASQIVEAFPKIPWYKADKTRASTVAGTSIPFGRLVVSNINDWLKKSDYANKVTKLLKEALDPVPMIDEKDLVAWITEKFTDTINKETKELEKQKETIKVSDTEDVLIDLQKWKDEKVDTVDENSFNV